jgi:hypothetical protein
VGLSRAGTHGRGALDPAPRTDTCRPVWLECSQLQRVGQIPSQVYQPNA